MSAWVKLPTLRQLTKRLRDLNEAFAHPEGGPGSVCLFWESRAPGSTVGEWVCGAQWEGWPLHYGPEEVPGNDTFDAVGAARRLLATALVHRVQRGATNGAR
jgi:hypothetical protein